MNFIATIEGLNELKETLSSERLEKQVIKSIGSVARELNSLLGTQVKKTYNIGSRSLNSTLVGSTESNFRRGAGFIENGLVYSGKKIPLREFPLSLSPTDSITSFIAPNIFTPLLRGKIKRKKPVMSVSVRIRRDKSTFIRGGFQGKVNSKIRVLRRSNYFTKGQTWDRLPTEEDLLGERSHYFELMGLSLPEMAANVYSTNPYIQNFKDSFATRVAEKLDL